MLVADGGEPLREKQETKEMVVHVPGMYEARSLIPSTWWIPQAPQDVASTKEREGSKSSLTQNNVHLLQAPLKADGCW